MTLQTQKVSLVYGDGDKTTYALQNITLCLPAQGFFGIMGPSGSGKSSLLYLMSGLKLPSEGRVLYDSVPISELPARQRALLRRKKFGFVFQQPFLLNYLTAKENILTAAVQNDRSAQAHADLLLQNLGVSHLADRTPAHLSGGEKQRIVVARAMMNSPEVIFADEPTAALDSKNGHAVINLLRSYRTKGAVVVVTHDASMLEGADHVFYLQDGMISDDHNHTLFAPSL